MFLGNQNSVKKRMWHDFKTKLFYYDGTYTIIYRIYNYFDKCTIIHNIVQSYKYDY